jgi:hypothetical protein
MIEPPFLMAMLDACMLAVAVTVICVLVFAKMLAGEADKFNVALPPTIASILPSSPSRAVCRPTTLATSVL